MSDDSKITFEWDAVGQRLVIHLNNSGIDTLVDYLQHLKTKQAPDDVMLMSPEWGGVDLTGDEDDIEGEKINLVKIMKWKD